MPEPVFRSRLCINQEKTRVDHPDIVGSIAVGAESYRVALWHQTTRDGAREYYSGVLQLASDRSSPRFKLKLYEMRKAVAADPDYHSPSASPIGPHSLFAYLWIRPSKDPPGEIAIGLELPRNRQAAKIDRASRGIPRPSPEQIQRRVAQ
jgi:hypothetical protein